MNWYNKCRLAGKSYRDSKNFVTLYHVSPENFTGLSPRSKFSGQSGLFLSPSYRSCIEDWGPYVQNKKQRKHSFPKYWDKLLDRLHELSAKQSRTPEEEQELTNLMKREESGQKTLDNSEYQRSQKGYQTLFIHKIACPIEVYKRTLERFNAIRKQKETDINIMFWSWGEQIFIFAEDLPQLDIVSTEQLSSDEFSQIYSNLIHGRGRSDPETWSK